MEQVICVNCYDFFPPSPRHKNQSYCMKPECRRAKKAAWKRTQMRINANFCQDQRLSNQKWVQNNRDYWTRYRKRNPDKADRNRILQRIRNKRRAANRSKCAGQDPVMIAKVDASTCHNYNMIGQFWLVPIIAKVDALKVNIVEVPVPYR
jgi:RNase P protein component